MSSPVSWSGQGPPRSERFDDIYHTQTGAWAQAQHVFLQGCGLPERWQGRGSHQPFTVVELGFGFGLNFLTTWASWLADPQRCDHLHYVGVEAFPVSPADLQRHKPELPVQAQALWQAFQAEYARLPHPLPAGFHRLLLQQGQVTLTLCVGMAQEVLPLITAQADAAYLDGFSPAKNPDLWSAAVFKGLARCLRPEAWVSTYTVAASVRQGLEAAGFVIKRRPGLPPKRECLHAQYRPSWIPRPAPLSPATLSPAPINSEASARTAVIIGAGLAGASLSWALCRRGWQVTLLDQGTGPAQGASGLPVGLVYPLVSTDETLASQITYKGCEWMQRCLHQLNFPEKFWREGPIHQRLKRDQGWRVFEKGLHISPADWVQHLLNHSPGLITLWQSEVASIQALQDNTVGDGPPMRQQWQVRDGKGQLLATAPVVILACATGHTRIIHPSQPALQALQVVRGQVSLGRGAVPDGPTLSGHGHFIRGLPCHTKADPPWDWCMGSTFERGQTSTAITAHSHASNAQKLQELAPELAALLHFDQQLAGWAQLRCTSVDRLPAVGLLPDVTRLVPEDLGHLSWRQIPRLPGLCSLIGLGARGLSLSALCAENLASQLNGDPLPLPANWVNALDPARFLRRYYQKK